MNYIIENYYTILTTCFSVVGVCATIASLTPTPKDDGIVKVIKKILDAFAFNFGAAKNKG